MTEIQFEIIVKVILKPDESKNIARAALAVLITRALENSPYDLISVQ